MSYVAYSWKKMYKVASDLGEELKRYGPFDHAVTILRGGLVPTRLLMNSGVVPECLHLVSVKQLPSYTSVLCSDIKEIGDDVKVLVIDDIIDSGKTFKVVMDAIPGKKTFCALVSKKRYVEAIYGIYVPEDKWVIFPWE
jgi:hypoxanthine phosphoribosyltransferase